MRFEVTHDVSDKANLLDNRKDGRGKLFNRDRFLVMDESFVAEKDYQTIRPCAGVDGPMLTQNLTRCQPTQEAVSGRRGLSALGENLARNSFFIWFFATVSTLLITAVHSVLTLILLSTIVEFDIHMYHRGCSQASDVRTLHLFTSTITADKLNQHNKLNIAIRLGPLAVVMGAEHSPPLSVLDVPMYCSLALRWDLITGARLDDGDNHTTIFVDDGESSDFAAIADGAQVIDSFTSASFSPRTPRFRPDIALWHWFLSHGGEKNQTAEAALSSGLELGQCWAYAGAAGQLGIQLADRIHISAIVVHHPLRESSLQSAPRVLELWGLHTQAVETSTDTNITDLNPPTNRSSSSPDLGPYGGLHILTGVFNITSGEQRQVFTLENTSYTGIAFERVVVRIVDNWGKDRYTCVYRIEIIGRQALSS